MKKVTIESILIWLIIATVAAVFSYILYRKQRIKAKEVILIPLLSFYISFVLSITVLKRVPSAHHRYNLELFWSLKAVFNGRLKLLAEIFWNIVLFIPIGFFLKNILNNGKYDKWISLVFCLLLSVGIELAQLLLRRGLFEFDDIFNNIVGSLIGIFVSILLKKVY